MKPGKRVFDDGPWIVEKSVTEIGDDCTLGECCVIQGHSLEDGLFKSDRIHIGNRCTVASRAVIHLGAVIEDDVTVDTDSLVLKGTQAPAGSLWRGNPADQVW